MRACATQNPVGGKGAAAGGMSYDEATNILRETYQREQEHKARVIDRRRRRGEVMPGEKLTRAEMDARMLAFLYVIHLPGCARYPTQDSQ